ncbi:nitrate regulatory protein [Pseudorhodoferax sp. Leaf274]|uniref:nitrate regulatory protein n=1 Tax=Pseudorhodoferax sp. Leaf274 TaxID=1736318 RepID=UPI0007032F40|nr:nitrate regulatory protein [Pseudorhodoferax sp. Leaf274]KQP47511.1 antitermination regulator [Pseudorhodoferax sp. Leaf274]
MKSGLHFLIAARECEIGDLEQLALTGELVGLIGQLVHALQRERGLSNLFLGSRGTRFAQARDQQLLQCDAAALELRRHFDAMDTQGTAVRNGARLFGRIATVLQALDALPALRQEIAVQTVTPPAATAAFVRLVAGLLQVVFEAADSATDPQISRALVALFNFMQGKEFAGQERAFGGACFAEGHLESGRAQQWLELIESQERCFRIALDFSDAAIQAAWRGAVDTRTQAELERLRRIGCTLRADGLLDPELAQVWYDCCTQRIDAMRAVEELLAAQLLQLCASRIAKARDELRNHEAIRDALVRTASAADTGEPVPNYGPHLERSIIDLVQEQARRLQQMADELDTVRASLNERKIIERAKGLLMATRKLSEADAHKMLRQTAMNQNRKLLDVAQSVLALSDYL